MMKKATIFFRNGDFFITAVDDNDTPESIGVRMVAPTGGFIICEDRLWGKSRTIVVNLGDVQALTLEDMPDEILS